MLAAGVPVQISHHKASGADNWGMVRESIKLIEQANARGMNVTADQYPYIAGSTILAAVVQNGALGGRRARRHGARAGREGSLRVDAAPSAV
jgi:N-acyl-D-aspartate/D-glutamate deacylase